MTNFMIFLLHGLSVQMTGILRVRAFAQSSYHNNNSFAHLCISVLYPAGVVFHFEVGKVCVDRNIVALEKSMWCPYVIPSSRSAQSKRFSVRPFFGGFAVCYLLCSTFLSPSSTVCSSTWVWRHFAVFSSLSVSSCSSCQANTSLTCTMCVMFVDFVSISSLSFNFSVSLYSVPSS